MTEQPRQRNRRLPGAVAGYFAMVYGAGFLLGVVRTLWLTPRLGERWAELLEMPVMLCVIMIAAHLLVRKFIPHCTRLEAVIVGTGALGLLLVAEVLGIWFLRGERITEFIADRDPVTGTIFLILLLVFAVAPAGWARGQNVPRGESYSKH